MRQSTLEKIEEQQALTKLETNYICFSEKAKNHIRFTNGVFFLTDEIIFEKRNCVIKKWIFKWKVLSLFKLNFEEM